MAKPLMDSIAQKAFLGTEFLTWLWFRSEVGEGRFEMAGPGEFEIELDSSLNLVDEGDADVRGVGLKGDAPGPSELMRRAVADGKKVERARFRVLWQNVAWTCQVNGETLDVSGIKLPTAARGGGNIGEYLRLRLETMEGFLQVWEALFEYYLALRLNADRWSEESHRLGEWLSKEIELA